MLTILLPRLLIAFFLTAVILLCMAKSRRMMMKVCAVLFTFSCIGGFSLYTFGYLPQAAGFADTLQAALRGMFSMARMFFTNDDYGHLLEAPGAALLDSVIWQIIFWLCHVFAVFVVISAIVAVFGRKITDNIRIRLRANLPLGKNCHFVICGCGKYMVVFLEDLQKTVSKERITIISGELNDANSVYEKLVDEGYAIIKGMSAETALKKTGADKPRRNTKVIAISESDEENLEAAGFIARKIIASGIKPENIRLEAYIMYSFIERAEYFTFAENAYGKVRFFAPHELRVRDFYHNHPLTRFIPGLIDADKARLKGVLNANGKIIKQDNSEYRIKNIFIGFGAANYQMLKGSILTGQLLGCDYNAVIYDKDIFADANREKPSLRQALFMNQSSGLFPGGDETAANVEYLESPKERYNIAFKNGNVLTKDFYADLIREVLPDDFTVIYISLGEDKLGVETACEIRQSLYAHGIVSADKARIFVKTREQSVYNDDLVINNPQSVINRDQKNALTIQCFGFDRSVLTKEHIVNETLDSFVRAVSNKNHETPWESLSENRRDINRQAAMAITTKLNLLGLELSLVNDKQQGETKTVTDTRYYERYSGTDNEKIAAIISLSSEIAKTSDEETKKALKAKRSGFILDYVQTENGKPEGVISDTPRNNLGRLEHLRWNTFHLVHGWTKMPVTHIGAGNAGRQNRFTKQHACITTFEDLIRLRKMQAEKAATANSSIPFEEAQAKADTIWYDFNLMDELPARLSGQWAVVEGAPQNNFI